MSNELLSSMLSDMSVMSTNMASMSSAMAQTSTIMSNMMATATNLAAATATAVARDMSMSMSSAAASSSSASGMAGMAGMGGMGGTAGTGSASGSNSSSSTGVCKMEMSWNWYTIDSCFLAQGWHVTTSGQFAGTCIGVCLWGAFIVFLAVLRRKFDAHIVSNRMRIYKRSNRPDKDIVPNAPGQCVPLGEDCEALNESNGVETEIMVSSTQPTRSSRFIHIHDQDKNKGSDNEPNADYEKAIHGRVVASTVDSDKSSSSLSSAPNSLRQRNNRYAPFFGMVRERGIPYDNDPSSPVAIRPKIPEQVVRALLYGFQYSITSLLALILMSFNGYVIISAFLGVFLGYLFMDWPEFLQQNENKEVESASPVCC